MWPLLLLLSLAQDQPTFRSDVSLVHVDAEVRQGVRVAGDLTKEDFHLTDSGKPQAIEYFAHEDQPLDVVLLFDTRDEMRTAVERVAAVAQTAFSDFRPQDRVAVMSFDCKPNLIADFTGDISAAASAIANQILQREFRLHTNGCSIQRGLDAAAQLFLTQPSSKRRRAVLALTDDKGSPTRPAAARATLLDLWKADAVVLGVVIHSGAWVIAIGPPYRGLRYAADKTGGDAIETADPAQALRQTIQRLRSRYSLYYTPPSAKPGEERKIRVQLTPAAARRCPGATIRARTGYLAH